MICQEQHIGILVCVRQGGVRFPAYSCRVFADHDSVRRSARETLDFAFHGEWNDFPEKDVAKDGSATVVQDSLADGYIRLYLFPTR
jgi:hypothetical protein